VTEHTEKKILYFGKGEREPLRFKDVGYQDFAESNERLQFMRVQSGYTLHYVKNGHGVLIMGGKTYEIGPGEVFFIPPDEPMMYYPDEADPWSYFWFFMRGESVFELGKCMGFSIDSPVRTVRSPQVVAHALDELFDSKFGQQELYHMAVSVFMQIFVEVIPKRTLDAQAIQAADVVSNAKEVIELNYTNADFSVDAIPKLLYVSHTHLCRLFKAETGMSPVAYLIEVRLRHATTMLRSHDCSVRELCDASGFGDERYFMKRFKKKYGMTVKEYRQRLDR